MNHSSNHTDNSNISLNNLGWDEQWDILFTPYKGPYVPGRIVAAHKTRYEVAIDGEIISVPISGAMKAKKLLPVVGDFVAVLSDPEAGTRMIVSLLSRRTILSRGGSGENTGQQVIAANIDTVFIVTDPVHDFSIPRLLRYLLIIRASGAQPVILINKSEIGEDIPSQIETVNRALGDIPVIPVSALLLYGFEDLERYLCHGKTVVFLGSSGVGKSTLTNALMGAEIHTTGDIRENDGRGRHTTTVRQLAILPSGCCIIDTPGMREIRVWTAGEHLDEEFSDIREIAAGCRFTDCSHLNEPGCAVKQAISEGRLDTERLGQYLKIQQEIAFEKDKAEIGLKRLEKQKWQGISELGKNYREKKRWIHNR